MDKTHPPDLPAPRDHGGNLDAAMAQYGGDPDSWLDLSTGINPVPYPVPALPQDAWTALPRRADMTSLCQVAARAYGTSATIAAFAGAQGAIQWIPQLRPPGTARVLSPTYNEHAAALTAAGWRVEACGDLPALAGAEIAVVVNPNNPDGRHHTPSALRDLSAQVGLLVVDESFVEVTPDLSLAPQAGEALGNVVVLRSFGKFYGLAGVRLGFALGPASLIAALQARAGLWPVTGPALTIASTALQDLPWQAETRRRLQQDAERLDQMASEAGWRCVGGTALFRTYHTADAAAAQAQLARSRVWSRVFPYSPHWLRLGLPGSEAGWTQLSQAIASG